MLSTLILSATMLGCTQISPTPVLPSRKEPLGANLDGITDWSRNFPFIDLIKQSREFGTPSEPWSAGKIKLDSKGWPMEDFGVVVMAAQTGVKNLGGTYKLSFKCKGTPTVKAVASTASISTPKLEGSSWKANVQWATDQEQLMLSFTNTNGGATDISLIRPGERIGPFSKQFVEHHRPFTTIRFMDWGATNGNKIEKWSQRLTPDSPSYARPQGVPYEVMIDLVNETKADAWICVPAHVDDEYITNLADLCKKRLDPSLKLYVEYSNEVWNWGFEQAQFNLQQAKLEGPKDPKMSWDGKNGEWTWPARRIAKQIAKISTIFKQVYGNRFASTVRPVLAAQIVWPENWLQEGINYLDHNHGAAKNVIYAFAVAPYFNLELVKDRKDLSKDDVLKALERSIDTMEDWGKFKFHQDLMKKTGLKWLCYEAGPDTFGPDNIAAKRDSQRDPRIKDLTLKFYKKWKAGGGELMNWFIAGATNWDSQYGTWGLKEDLSAPPSPKEQALLEILNGRVR